MKTLLRSFAVVASFAAAAAAVPDAAIAAGGARASAGAGWHGSRGPAGGSFRGGHWGYRGYGGPGYFWGGVGLGLGIGAIGYYGGWYGPYAPYGPYYDGYYYAPAPAVVVDPGYVAPAEARSVTRSGQPVPQASRGPDPIFYPKNGQGAAATESDRRECNRWATTQSGAMADASIFQRATLACMEGRGYTVK